MPKQPRYFSETDDRPKCRYCGERFSPLYGKTGEFCNPTHWRLWLKERVPDSWRFLHTWMMGYQKVRGMQPLMSEIVASGKFKTRSSVIYALRGLQRKGLIDTVAANNFKRRYRAIGKLPQRKS